MAQREYMQQTVTRSAEIDRGLQAYMSKVYALMAGAMVLTGVVAYVVGSNASLMASTMTPESAPWRSSPRSSLQTNSCSVCVRATSS